MITETIKSVKDYVKSSMSAGNPAPAAIEVMAFNSSNYHSSYDIHTDHLKSLPVELYDNLDLFPDNMPVAAFEYMDDEEYNSSVDANCDHIPFSDYLEGENPQTLVVVLPYDWEDYMQYWVITAGIGEVDTEHNDLGLYCGMDKGKPIFAGVHDDRLLRYGSESEAKSQIEKLREYYEKTLDFNESIAIATIRYEWVDGSWEQDEVENDIVIDYQFKDLTGAVVVVWSWETHVGYARKFIELRTVSEFNSCHDESLLVPVDYTNRPQASLLFTADEAENLIEDDTYDEELEKRLFDKSWKWTNPDFIRWTFEVGNDMP